MVARTELDRSRVVEQCLLELLDAQVGSAALREVGRSRAAAQVDGPRELRDRLLVPRLEASRESEMIVVERAVPVEPQRLQQQRDRSLAVAELQLRAGAVREVGRDARVELDGLREVLARLREAPARVQQTPPAVVELRARLVERDRARDFEDRLGVPAALRERERARGVEAVAFEAGLGGEIEVAHGLLKQPERAVDVAPVLVELRDVRVARSRLSEVLLRLQVVTEEVADDPERVQQVAGQLIRSELRRATEQPALKVPQVCLGLLVQVTHLDSIEAGLVHERTPLSALTALRGCGVLHAVL